MQVFIKDKGKSNYFNSRKNKRVRMLCWRGLVRIMVASIIRLSVIKTFPDRIRDNVHQLLDYMGYQDAILNCTQHHQGQIYCTINSTTWGYWGCQFTRRNKSKWFQCTHQKSQSYFSHILRQQSCIEITTKHCTRPRTKKIFVRLLHICSHVVRKTITIYHISTKDQIAYILKNFNMEASFIN